MFDLTRFTIGDMISCGAALRDIGAASARFEDAADGIARYLYEQLGDGRGRACALVRVFTTCSPDRLAPAVQTFLQRSFGPSEAEAIAPKYLLLVGTAGDLPEWNRVEASARHRAMPLTQHCIEQMPMVSHLLQRLGIDIGVLLDPAASMLVDPSRRTYNVFHVPIAEDSPYVPDQWDFVSPYGIRSVLGFGGVLPSGNLFASILFSRAPVSRETAGFFRVIAISAKLALVRFDEDWAGTRAETSGEGLENQLRVTQELVEAFEATQQEQSDRIEQTLDSLRRAHEIGTEANSFLDSILENIPDMIFVKDAAELRFVRFNRAGERVLGYSRAEMLGKSDYDFFAKQEADFFTATDRAVLAAKELVDVPEEPIHTRGGGVSWLHTKKVPILDQLGMPRYLLGIAEDITERRRLEERRRLVAALGSVSVSAQDARTTLEGVASLALPVFADACVLHIRSNEHLAGDRVAVHDTPEGREALLGLAAEGPQGLPHLAGLSRVLLTGEPILVEHLDETTVGSIADCAEDARALLDVGARSVLIAPLVARTRRIGAIAFLYTEAGRCYGPGDVGFALEYARCAAHAVDNISLYASSQAAIGLRDQFLSIASHELRTPLTTLMLTLQTLQRIARDASVDARLMAKLDATVRHARRLNGLIDALLDASRLVRGRISIERERGDLVAIVAEILERHREQARSVSSELRFEPAEPALIGEWDPLRLEQVVTNLVSNALKFGKGRPIDVSVSRVGDRARLEVRDQGIGIQPADAQRIFRPYERATAAKEFGGFGLGLYITKQIVDAHGGTVVVDSQPGEGATFVVELPMTAADAAAAAA